MNQRVPTRRTGTSLWGLAAWALAVAVVGVATVFTTTVAAAAAMAGPAPTLAEGQAQCDRGSYRLAVDTLTAVHRAAPPGAERARAAAALGMAWMALRQYDAARRLLAEAYAEASEPAQRARHGLDLANLEAQQRRIGEAQRLYDAVLALAPNDPGVRLGVALNRATLLAPTERLPWLQSLHPRLADLQPANDRAAYLMNLGHQAEGLGRQPAARRLAWLAFSEALATARLLGDPRLQAAALDRLAQGYEDDQRPDEALRLSLQGVQQAQHPDARDLLIPLEWRRGRLLAAQGALRPAAQAYQRAIDQIEAVRQDIPIDYENGRSSFRDTLEPVYLGLADLLLREAHTLDPVAQAAQLRRVRDTLERVKQTELEDFLGNRCSLAGAGRRGRPLSPPASGGAPGAATDAASLAPGLAPGTAVLYPVILPDRLELLLETVDGIEQRTVATPAASLRQDATAFAAALRGRRPIDALSRRLHAALLAPVQEALASRGVRKLVVVPDGVLRLVPFGALHDGQGFAIERLAISVVPAVTLPDEAARPAASTVAPPLRLLLAGVSEPGAVVTKLPEPMVARILGSTAASGAVGAATVRAMVDPDATRNLVATEAPPASLATDGHGATPGSNPGPTPGTTPPASTDPASRHRRLQRQLALGGVVEEVRTIAPLAQATVLLNEGFSVQAFSERVRSGEHSVVHIASHGVFGSTAGDTFVLAHDDLITIDQLQALLRGPALRRQPIRLLTLSACETAEGDDRAPLGLSGAALKAQAQSALGSLWPVSDAAATLLMGSFYRRLVEAGAQGEAMALQSAQVQMLRQPGLQHPYFWAPFILVERRL